MRKNREKVIQIIIFHTKGNGAFSRLSKDGVIDTAAWNELVTSLNDLARIWKKKNQVECSITAALFDFLRQIDEVEENSTETVKTEINNIFCKINLSKLFHGTHGECPERIFPPPDREIESWDMTEAEAVKCLLFHTQGGGAIRQARTYRKYVAPMWNQLIAAIRQLKKYWRGRQMVEREIAAALVDFPLGVQYQADFFKEHNPNGEEHKQFKNMAETLAVEIAALFKENCM